jgi:DNA polymerase-1
MPQGSLPRLFLIDGYALIYRAFFAMISRPLRTSRGENTSAAWGVANFLHRLFAEHDPQYVAWVHDAGTSFRTEVFADYKATREKLDDELQEDFDRSVERIEELLRRFSVSLVTVDGYEADDVIGTLATQGADAGIDVVIVSGDKDFYQLIGPRVSLLNPGRRGPGGVEEHWVDRSNAHERLGVPPEQVIDYLALVGDSSDNVPGVRGIGDKTARALIETFGDLESILSHAGEVKGKRAREALLGQGDNAQLSRQLVTIHRDVPVVLDLEAFRSRPRNDEALGELYAELEFHSLQQKLEVRATRTPTSPARAVHIVRVDEIGSVVEAGRGGAVSAVAVAATGPDPLQGELVGLALASLGERAWYFPLAHQPAQGDLVGGQAHVGLPPLNDPRMAPLVELLEDAGHRKAGHDVKHLRLVFRRAGVEFAGVEFDSMLASFVLDPGRRSHALEDLALEHLGTRLRSSEALLGKGKSGRSLGEVSPEQTAAFCGEAALAVLALQDCFRPQLVQQELLALLEELELPLIEVLADMEWRGIAVDTGLLGELSKQFGAELDEISKAIRDAAGTEFNINSTPQLRHVLFEKLGLPVLKKTKTGPSTDADVLSELAAMGHELPRLLLAYRELAKLCSTYVDVLPQRVNPATGRIHTDFSQTGAATGRLSSSEPNLQNIPVRTTRGEQIRRCFVPVSGAQLVVADYSQIELRLLAHLSQDEAFIDAFQRGGDIHRETAAIIFDVSLDGVTSEMRAQAKTINFATIYGQGAFALSRQLSISQEEAREFIDRYFERFRGVRRFLDDCIARAREDGYVETLFGRRRYIPELKDRSYSIRTFGERVAMNSPLQGSAADLIKRAMINIDRVLWEARLTSGILLQVHDELVLESPVDEVTETSEIVRREMVGAAELSVPLLVDIGVGPNWLEAKS